MEKKLPKNWVSDYLYNVLEPVKTGVKIYDGIKSYYSTGSIKDNGIFEEGIYDYYTKPSRANREVEIGDILQARMSYTDKALLVNESLKDSLFSTGFIQLRPFNKTINSKYVFYFLKSDLFHSQKDELASGTTQVAINDLNAKNIEFPLPPLAEQNRIVAKLDALFAQLETIKTSMAKVPLLLKDFRQQVLTQAVTGKLTEEWRKGKELDSIILSEIEEERKNLKKLKSINDGKKSFTYKDAISPIIGVNTKGIDKLFILPYNWIWVTLDQVTWNISDGPHFSPSYSDITGKRFISMRNVTPQGINFEDCKYVSIDDHNEFIKRGKPEKGDLLYTKGGSTGIPCLIEDDTDFSYWVHVALLKPISKFIDSKYLKNALLSQLCYKQSQAFTHGVGNQDLGLTRMTNIVFPLPSIKEQQEIVSRVESLFAKADAIEKQYENLKAKIDSLPQAILHKAFKGELTKQLDGDGDARELLQQIQELKVTASKTVKSKKTKSVAKKV